MPRDLELEAVGQLGEVLVGDLDDGQELLAVATSEPFAGRASADVRIAVRGPGLTKARKAAVGAVLSRLLGGKGRAA